MKGGALVLILATGCYAAHERPPVCDDAPEPTGLPRSGQAVLASIDENLGLAAGFVDVSLDDYDAETVTGTGVIASAGDCVVLSGGAVAAMSEDAGDVMASDGDERLATAHFAGRRASPYDDGAGVPPSHVADGDVVTITGQGASVSPFAACVRMPQAPSEPLPTTMPLHGPFGVSWIAAGGAQRAHLEIGAVFHGAIVILRCIAPATSGRIDVPEMLRAGLPHGSRPQITFTLENTRVVAAGDYAVRATAAHGLTGNILIE